MIQTIRLFLLVEAATFFIAALIHAGMFIGGYEHREARIAESVIGAVLLAGAAVSLMKPAATRLAGLASQTFALLGTLVGIGTIVVGIGPRTAPDVIYHAGIVAVLIYGLFVTRRARAEARPV